MNFTSGKRIGISAAAVTGVVLAASFLAAPKAQADQWDKMTLLTTSEPIQIENTYLEPGTYMLKLVNSSSDRHIVQIFNRDRSHLYNTVLAIPNYRLQPTGDSQFLFYETPQGSVKAMHAWFYPGDNFGQEFRYPTNLRQVAYNAPPAAPAPVLLPAPAPEAPPAVVEPQPEPAPAAPEAVEQPAPQPEEPVEIAQNSPPPALPEPAPAPSVDQDQSQQAQPAASSTLPQTASPYPIIGLSGLLALGLYFGLRSKQLN